MSEVVKWGLLVAGAVAIIGLIVALPMSGFINAQEFAAAVDNVVDICQDAFLFGRGLINNLFLPFGRKIISGLMIWFLGKWALMAMIKVGTGIYHFIFK